MERIGSFWSSHLRQTEKRWANRNLSSIINKRVAALDKNLTPVRPTENTNQRNKKSTEDSKLASAVTSFVVLETAVLVSRPLETDFLRSWSWSWPWSRSVGLFFKTTHVFAEPISCGCLLVFASYSSNKISNITKP